MTDYQNNLALKTAGTIEDITTTIAGEDVLANRLITESGCSFSSISADTAVISAATVAANGSGYLERIICTASSSLVIKVYDNTAASGTVVLDSITLTAGSIYEVGVRLTTGLYVDFVSGTGTITVVYR